MVTAGTLEQRFTYDSRNATLDMNGFVIKVADAMPHPTVPFVFAFSVEIQYIANAMNSNLTVSCGNRNTNKNITITVNSKFYNSWKDCICNEIRIVAGE